MLKCEYKKTKKKELNKIILKCEYKKLKKRVKYKNLVL